MIRLDGKFAIVTGATRSIGEFIARGLHAAGASVLVTGIEDEAGRAVVASLGDRAEYRHVDVGVDDDIESCIRDMESRNAVLDILVNCACSYVDKGLATSRADWLSTLNVNLVGAAIFVQKAVPIMKQPGGVIVNIGSVSGKAAMADRGPVFDEQGGPHAFHAVCGCCARRAGDTSGDGVTRMDVVAADGKNDRQRSRACRQRRSAYTSARSGRADGGGL